MSGSAHYVGLHRSEHADDRERTTPVNQSPTATDTPDTEHDGLRRRLMAGGLAAAALGVLGSRTASAAPNELSAREMELLRFAQLLELTARDLYDAATAAGAPGPLWEAMSEQHEAYAQAIASITGLSATGRNDAVYDAQVDGFRTDSVLAAHALESAAAATHTELLAHITQAHAAEVIASIVSSESRHCVVLADVAGLGTNLDINLINSADPLELP